MVKPRDYLSSDIKRLFTFSGNQCSKPNCKRPVIAEDVITVVGKICHIEAASSKGPRYRREMTDKERRSYENLILINNFKLTFLIINRATLFIFCCITLFPPFIF